MYGNITFYNSFQIFVTLHTMLQLTVTHRNFPQYEINLIKKLIQTKLI